MSTTDTDLSTTGEAEAPRFRMPHIYVILFVFTAVAAVLKHFVPAGLFDRVTVPNGRIAVDPDFVLAPLYGILVADYYLIRKQRVNLQELFTSDPAGAYYYDNGWNRKAMQAFGIAAIFSIATVWVPALGNLSGFGWIIGAVLGGAFHIWLMRDISAAHTARAGEAGHN